MPNQFEQSTSAGFIVFVGAQMLRQLLDAACDDCDLHFGRAGIGLVAMIIRDQFGFYFLSQWHDVRIFLSLRIWRQKHRTTQVSMPAAAKTAGQDQSWALIIPEKSLSTGRHAVSPILLAFIHQFICSSNDTFDCVVWMAHARTDGDRHTQVSVIILNLGLFNKSSYFFSHNFDSLQVDVEDQSQKFLTAPATARIGGAQVLSQCVGYKTKDLIARQVAVQIVEVLKNDQCQ